MQIPRKLAQLFPNVDLVIEHAYGREFPSEALREGRYRLVVHCGGCMIDPQKVRMCVYVCMCVMCIRWNGGVCYHVNVHITTYMMHCLPQRAYYPSSCIMSSHTHVYLH